MSMHEHIVLSEPSVTVAEGAVATKGFSDKGATEHRYQLLQSDALALEIALLPWARQMKAPAGLWQVVA